MIQKQNFATDKGAFRHLEALIESGKIGEYPLLGEGLSGKVYDYDGFAVKVYKENYSENDDYKTLSGLNGHPAFPAFHYIDQRKRWMVVEKVDGFTLAEAVRSGEKLDSRTYAQIEEIVEDCYDEGIIPSDLHLNNLMLDKDTNRIRVIDTGRFFFTEDKEAYRSRIGEELECLQYHCGLFGSLFSSSRHKHRRRRKYSSSYPRRYKYSSSYPRHHKYSSSYPRRRRYSSPFFSSSDRYRHRKYKKYFSFSSS